MKRNDEEIEQFYRQYGEVKGLILDAKESDHDVFNEKTEKQIVKMLKKDYSDNVIEQIKRRRWFDEEFKFIMMHWKRYKTYYSDYLPLLAIGNPDKYYREGVFSFKILVVVKENGSFGELALISNARRAATIICKSDAELLTLNKMDFKKIFSSILVTEEEKFNYFEKMFGEKLGGKTELIELQYKFHEKKYCRNSIIFKEGDPIDYIYIIREGEVQLSMNIKSNELNGRLSNQNGKRYKTFPISLELIDAYTFFGEDDLILERDKRTYTAKALSALTVVYRMDKSLWPYVEGNIKKAYPNIARRSVEKCLFRLERLQKQGEVIADMVIPKKFNEENSKGSKFIENKKVTDAKRTSQSNISGRNSAI